MRLLLLSFCAIMLSACTNDNENSEASLLVDVGSTVPDFSLIDADGHSVSSTSLSGKVYVLNFFDTGCKDCQNELQVLQRIYDKYQGNVPVLNVPRSQTESELQMYWQKAGLSVPYYMPSDKGLYYQFATKTIPRTFVVGADGKIIAAYDDSPIADFETLNGQLQSALSSSAVNMKLKINVPKRANGNNNYYFHNEYIISKLHIYFFDSNTKKLYTRATLTDLNQEESSSDKQYDITYLIKNFRLQAGVYDIFAIANYDNAPEKVTNENEFVNLIDSLTYKEGIEASIPETGSVMTSNATSLLNVNLIPWINKEYMLTINMERVLAKLQIGVSQNTFQLVHEGKRYADINLTNYKLVNLNKIYYLFPHRDILSVMTEKPEFVMTFNFQEYSDVGDQYVVDPLFYDKKPNRSSAERFAQHYESWFGNYTSNTTFAPMPSAGNYGFAYLLENTTFKDSQKNGYSPGIVFKGSVSPEFVYLYDFNAKALKEEYRPEYWPQTLYLYKYNFYGSIQAVNVASGFTLDELTTYTDAQLSPYGIKKCMFIMGAYETYYTYWIRHRNNEAYPMGAMEYGIVRNNFYKLIVTGISGLGNSVITPDIMRDNYPNSYTDVSVN
jgi:peroxiredoxin